MELNLSSEEAAFRDEVRAFIAENYPAEMRVPNPETDLPKEQMLLWHTLPAASAGKILKHKLREMAIERAAEKASDAAAAG